MDGFKQAMANLGNVVIFFGGACFYGDGLRVKLWKREVCCHQLFSQGSCCQTAPYDGVQAAPLCEETRS